MAPIHLRADRCIKRPHHTHRTRLLHYIFEHLGAMKSVIAVSVAVILCLGIGSSLGQIISIGQCSEPSVVQNFDVEAYLGLWYEVSRYEQTFQRNGECVTAEYSLNEDGSVRVQNRMLVPPSGKFDEDIGRAVISFPEESPLQAKLNVSFGGMPPIKSNYWVLDTDYTSFAFVWSCFPVSDTIKGENYWLLSRTVELPATVQERVDELTDAHLIRRHIRQTQHDLYYCNLPEETPEVGESPKAQAKAEDLRSKRVIL
ncbi:hypothetical protein RP20_CCG012696 [Aedes albopictus]|nr:hypothetical protein RP20_CCG012696 [Aedes albopictus]